MNSELGSQERKEEGKFMDERTLGMIREGLKEKEEIIGCRILYACESGSRAWGFPSPDSDYDVRFIYTYAKEKYLAINSPKDSYNFPINDELDYSGWDIRKVLMHLKKSNATLFEWFQSPVVYKIHRFPGRDESFLDAITALGRKCYIPAHLLNHYLGLLNKFLTCLAEDQLKIKHLFYILRPLLAANWIIDKGEIPPVEFPKLMDIIKREGWLIKQITDLVELKSRSNESFKLEVPPRIRDFIHSRREYCEKNRGNFESKNNSPEPLNKFFVQIVESIE